MTERKKQGRAVQSPAGRLFGRHWACIVLALVTIVASPLMAQEELAEPPGPEFVEPGAAGEGEALAAPPVSTEKIWRFYYLDLDQMAYVEHPFYQITGDSDYRKGHAGNSEYGISVPPTAESENIAEQIVHALPNFGIEAGQNTDIIFPRSYSIGFDYIRISQTDSEAVNTTKSTVTAPGITMDSYYYTGYVRAWAFPFDAEGINYFMGVGIGALNGKILATPTASSTTQTVAFSQTPIGITSLGLQIMGENFGFVYEIRVVKAKQVKFSNNPYFDEGVTAVDTRKVDFSGSMVRLALFYQF